MNNKIIYSNNTSIFLRNSSDLTKKNFLLIFLFYTSTLYTSKEFSDQISQRKFYFYFYFTLYINPIW